MRFGDAQASGYARFLVARRRRSPRSCAECGASFEGLRCQRHCSKRCRDRSARRAFRRRQRGA